MNEHEHTDGHWEDARGSGVFRAVFRLIAISDLYGPERAIEWAQSLLDDPDLLSAFAHAPERRSAEITIRRLGVSVPPMTDLGRRPDFPSLN